MAKTVIGLYDDLSDAQHVVKDLVDAGFSRDRISLVASDKAGQYATVGDRTDVADDSDTSGAKTGAVTGGLLGGLGGLLLGLGALAIPGIGPAIAAGPIVSALVGAGVGAAGGGLLGALVDMGVSGDEAESFAEGVRRGGTIVAVNTQDDEVDRVVAVMNRYNPVDIEERAAQWGIKGWAAPERTTTTASTVAPAAATGTTRHETRTDVDREARIPVIEEQMVIGKRQVGAGGVRVHAYMEETPVEREIQLRKEHVDIERHPVDRPVSEADLAAFEDRTIEISETSEEAVVGKRARVVEEVVVSKEVEEQSETVRGTVRQTKVDVDRVGEHGTAGMTGFDADRDYYQSHFQTNYARLGGTYADYEPAYTMGYTLANDKRYSGRSWADIEADARTNWESQHKGTWDKFKDAIRHSWERGRKHV